MLMLGRVRLLHILICNHVCQESVIILCNTMKRIPIQNCSLISRYLTEGSTLLICATYFVFKLMLASSFLICHTELLIAMCVVQSGGK